MIFNKCAELEECTNIFLYIASKICASIQFYAFKVGVLMKDLEIRKENFFWIYS